MSEQIVEMQLRLLNQSWIGIINRAEVDKRAFNVIAQQCSAFYTPKKGVGFMWQDDFKRKYMGPNVTNPTFQVTIAKAFEYVAIIGPLLYWNYPYRKVSSYRAVGINPEALAMGDPYKMQQLEAVAQQEQLMQERMNIRNELYEKVLNYIQQEQPGGGLAQHTEDAITESLVKGRGCLWSEPYRYPGSGRTLVGSFFDSVDNLFVDPDCTDPTLSNAKWIARRRRTPYWELERKFNLPKNYLRDKAKFETGTLQGVKSAQKKKNDDKDGVEWFEVYTRCGVGVRIDGSRTSMDDAWDEVVGDYAYLAICKSCDYPLNCPPYLMMGEGGDEEIAAAFEWPCGPLWADDRWPVSVLDYYHDTSSAWPIAPLAAGLGELICLNVLVAAYVSQAYESQQTLIGYIESASADVEKALKNGGSPAFIKVKDNYQKSINDVVSFLNRPEMNNGLIEAINFVIRLFEERTGLSELMYGRNPVGAQDRSAAATNIKNDRVQVRPDFMAKKVAAWQSEVAKKEAIIIRFHMTANDVEPLLGQMGAIAWHELVESEDPEVVVRGTGCTVEASDIRKPDKARESSNMQNLVQTVLPVLSQYGFATRDFGPINGFFMSLGDSMEQDVSQWQIPNQGPSPEEQQQQQLAMEEQAAKADKLRADAEKSRADTQQLQFQFETEQQSAQHKMAMDAETTRQRLEAGALQAHQKLAVDSAMAAQKLQINAATAAQKMQADQQKQEEERFQNAQKFFQIMNEKIAMQKLKEQAARAQINSGGNQ